jgi:multicomponent Na+:H+ antiporter subunit B
VGLLGIITGGVFLANFLSHGTLFSLVSAGTIPVLNILIGVKVGISLFLAVWVLSDPELLEGGDM